MVLRGIDLVADDRGAAVADDDGCEVQMGGRASKPTVNRNESPGRTTRSSACPGEPESDEAERWSRCVTESIIGVR